MINFFIKLKLKKKDNKGATLILAIVAIAFVGVLASAILAAASTNYRLKYMDKYSKGAFYSAESVTDEIYAGLGKLCFTNLDEAYNDTANTLIYTAGTGTLLQHSNTEANTKMLQKYVSLTLKSITTNSVTTDTTTAIALLNSYITNQTNAQVISMDTILPMYENAIQVGYTLPNTVVQYKSSATDEYFSTVTVDINLRYPEDLEIDFISANNDLKSYLDYCLIAMDEINVGTSIVSTANTTIQGGMYAGDGGINIPGNCSLTLGADVMLNGRALVQTVAVTNGDITLSGESRGATFNVTGEDDIWCQNINVGNDYGGAVVNYTNSGARTYASDDLNLEGDGSNVTIQGRYLGFGKNSSTTEGVKDAATSSAIVVNGHNCTLNMTNLDYLLLAGKGYVMLDDDTAYATGDSLALKGNQEIYLVPAKYIKGKDDSVIVSNPTETPDDLTVSNLKDCIYYKLGLLDSKMYETKVADGKTYYYLKFKDTTAQKEYVKCIITDNYLEALASSKGITVSTSDTSERNSIKSRVTQGLIRFFDGGTTLKVNNNAELYTSGTLVEVGKDADGNTVASAKDSNAAYSDVVAATAELANRYKLMKSFLELDDTINYTTWPSQMIIGGASITVEDQSSLKTIYERVLNVTSTDPTVSTLDSMTDNVVYTEGNTIAAVLTSAKQATYDVPSGITGGVIVGYGVDINVSNNFEGLIITDGKINLKNNITITTGSANKAEETLSIYDDVAKYFQMYKPSSSSNKIPDIDISDLVQYEYWRKNG